MESTRNKIHEFLHPSGPVYRECFYCGERKSMVCLKCGYCYECHPVIEYAEREALNKNKLQYFEAV